MSIQANRAGPHVTYPVMKRRGPLRIGSRLVGAVLALASGVSCACTERPPDAVNASGGAATSEAGNAGGGAAPASTSHGAGSAAVSGSGNANGGGGAAGSPNISAGAPPNVEPRESAAGAANDDAGDDTGAPLEAGLQPLPSRVLLYHYSTLDIASVPAQLEFFKQQLTSWGYQVDDSVDPAAIDDQNLSRYSAVAMINTCFEPFGKGKPDTPQSQALQRFLRRGGGLFGTHCASVTFQSATPPVLYNQILGGRGGGDSFDGKSLCRTLGTHPTVSALPASFSFTGNLDDTDFLAPDSAALVKCQWQGGADNDVNVSWYRSEGAGRVFYTNFAKVAADLTNTTIGPHVVSGLSWVLHIGN